jgi:hypothetical protein
MTPMAAGEKRVHFLSAPSASSAVSILILGF